MSVTYRIGIAGAGRMARTLGRLLRERGEPVSVVASRNLESAKHAAAFIGGPVEAIPFATLAAECSHLLIAVPDKALRVAADQLAGESIIGRIVLHTCGSKGPEALQTLQDRGNSCGVIHPLQTVPTPEHGVRSLPGSSFAAAGDPAAVAWAEQIIEVFGGKILPIRPGSWPLYHAAAVMASNYQVALLSAARDLLAAAGVAQEDALLALAPLIRASMENTLALGPELALTGPIQRGDSATVATHIQALANQPEHYLNLYQAAGAFAIRLAGKQGLSEQSTLEMETLLQTASSENKKTT